MEQSGLYTRNEQTCSHAENFTVLSYIHVTQGAFWASYIVRTIHCICSGIHIGGSKNRAELMYTSCSILRHYYTADSWKIFHCKIDRGGY